MIISWLLSYKRDFVDVNLAVLDTSKTRIYYDGQALFHRSQDDDYDVRVGDGSRCSLLLRQAIF